MFLSSLCYTKKPIAANLAYKGFYVYHRRKYWRWKINILKEVE